MRHRTARTLVAGALMAGVGVAASPAASAAAPARTPSPKPAKRTSGKTKAAGHEVRARKHGAKPATAHTVSRPATRPAKKPTTAKSTAKPAGKSADQKHAVDTNSRKERLERRAQQLSFTLKAAHADANTLVLHNRLVRKIAAANIKYQRLVHRVKVHEAINFAMAQLGKPYVFNANGPNAWDCSGLTAGAYRAAGIRMDDYSGSQWNAFAHVPLNQLQQGDLVFLGPGGTQHVAMYIGFGMQIAAPHTGTVVKIQPLMNNITGAVRPA